MSVYILPSLGSREQSREGVGRRPTFKFVSQQLLERKTLPSTVERKRAYVKHWREIQTLGYVLEIGALHSKRDACLEDRWVEK
jgi:hypothetical protein